MHLLQGRGCIVTLTRLPARTSQANALLLSTFLLFPNSSCLLCGKLSRRARSPCFHACLAKTFGYRMTVLKTIDPYILSLCQHAQKVACVGHGLHVRMRLHQMGHNKSTKHKLESMHQQKTARQLLDYNYRGVRQGKKVYHFDLPQQKRRCTEASKLGQQTL